MYDDLINICIAVEPSNASIKPIGAYMQRFIAKSVDRGQLQQLQHAQDVDDGKRVCGRNKAVRAKAVRVNHKWAFTEKLPDKLAACNHC
jgi:hypothetical protein